MTVGVPNPGSVNHNNVCNNNKFHGIIGVHPDKTPKDDRKIVTNTSISPYNMMVKFTKVDPITDLDVVVGSGAIVGRRHILTAGHVVYNIFDDNPITDDYQKQFLTVLKYDGEQTGIDSIFLHDDLQLGQPWSKIGDPNPAYVKALAAVDFSLVTTTDELFPANSNFFKYDVADDDLWNNEELTHLGFPSNASSFTKENGIVQIVNYPCWDAKPPRPDLFSGYNFGQCDGQLREQKLTNAVSARGFGYIENYFDLTRGHSGGPVFQTVGSQHTIYAIQCLVARFCPSLNLAHRINEMSVQSINEWMSMSGGP